MDKSDDDESEEDEGLTEEGKKMRQLMTKGNKPPSEEDQDDKDSDGFEDFFKGGKSSKDANKKDDGMLSTPRYFLIRKQIFNQIFLPNVF